MRNGLPNKLTEEDRDYEISSIVGHHDFAADGDKEYKREYLVRYRGYDPEDSLWHNDEHLKKQAPKVLKKYLKNIGEQKTYMQNDQRVVSKDDNKNKTKTKEQAAAKSRQPAYVQIAFRTHDLEDGIGTRQGREYLAYKDSPRHFKFHFWGGPDGCPRTPIFPATSCIARCLIS